MDAILVLGGGRFFVAKPVEKVVQNTTVESVKSLLTVVIEIIFCAVKIIVCHSLVLVCEDSFNSYSCIL